MQEEAIPSGEGSPGQVMDLLLDVATVLLASGAHSARIIRNLTRMAETWGYQAEILLSFSGVLISLHPAARPDQRLSAFKRGEPYGVHFGILTETSLLTWKVAEERLPPDEARRRWGPVKALPRHPAWAMLAGAGAACASLCLLLGGDSTDAGFAGIAAVSGLAVKQQAQRLRFNPMIGITAASLVTTLIAGIDVLGRLGHSPEKALAAGVLYLVPGVPLINCTIDLIEGHVPTAIARGVYGGFILLCIAVGMAAAILLSGIRHF